MIRAAVLALSLAAGTQAQAAGPDHAYAVEGRCDGYDRARIETAKRLCLGLVWQRGASAAGPRMPRDLLEIAPGDWLVTDLGGWEAGRGALWRLSLEATGARWTRLIGGLSMPHTVAFGPDGRVYVAEMSRIFALDPTRLDQPATVVGDLPDNRLHENRHPLSSFVFHVDGALLVNVGAPSDRCLRPDG